MRKKNGGYTLVELIVTIAILAVVGIGIGTMISNSMKQYRMSSAEVSIQQESQLVGNQLANLVMNANDGVSAGTGELKMYHYDLEHDVHSKTVISYDAEARMLTYSAYQKDSESGTWTGIEDETDQCLAEYVTSFTVKVLDEKGNKVTTAADRGDHRGRQVKMQISYELDGKTYDYEQTVTLRNQVLMSDRID